MIQYKIPKNKKLIYDTNLHFDNYDFSHFSKYQSWGTNTLFKTSTLANLHFGERKGGGDIGNLMWLSFWVIFMVIKFHWNNIYELLLSQKIIKNKKKFLGDFLFCLFIFASYPILTFK